MANQATKPRPLYQQVKDLIQERIAAGKLTQNERLPSEHELMLQTGFSRMTVHRALRELAATGALIRIQGVGTFVAEQKPQAALLDIGNIADEVDARGHRYDCIVHLLEREQADAETARALDLPLGGAVFHSILVHFEDSAPVQYEERYVNPSMAPAYLHQDFQTITPHQYLMTIGPLTNAEHSIEAILAGPSVCRALEIGPDEPCLLMTRRTWTNDVSVTLARLTCPGKRYRFWSRSITAK
jgi:GntR family histidine utilization transcriptional repressor